jgi:ArsR family transcriptional regulator
MAFSKAPLFDSLPFVQSLWSKALAHPARIIILNHLLENGSTPYQDLVRLVPLAPTTVSQHLRQLRTRNLIAATEVFPHTHYSINRNACSYLAMLLTELQLQFIR